MKEDDPTFLSDEESERVSQILDRTPQIDREEALRRVIGNERMRRLMDAENAPLEAVKQSAPPSSRPAKPAYRPRYKPQTDLAAAEQRDLEQRDQERRDQPLSAEDDARNREMLDRFSRGNFTPPDENPEHQE